MRSQVLGSVVWSWRRRSNSTSMAFIDRYVKLRVMLEGPEGQGLITYVYINPITIDAFTEEVVSFDTAVMEGQESDAVRVVTKHDVYLVLMPVDEFIDLMNSRY